MASMIEIENSEAQIKTAEDDFWKARLLLDFEFECITNFQLDNDFRFSSALYF